MATNSDAKITVVFLLYHAPQYVAGLVEAIGRQRHPRHQRQGDWLDVLFMDNGSTDDTGRILGEAVAAAGAPPHYRIVTNPVNIGYARAVNKAFGLARTPYVLTCHCDCLFGSDDYVAGMLELLERQADAGTITGQPAVPAQKPVPFAEKVNLVSYLMDIFPPDTDRDLVPIGFTEGRCDGFRVAAVEAAGYYDTSHHSAGEDQILCAGMRRAGFQIYQAPRLRYFLSVSDEQDTVWKLVRHARLFGEKHPILVLRGGAAAGVMGSHAGANRRARTVLRASQLASALAYVTAIGGALAGAPFWTWAGILAAVLAGKAWIFQRHARAVRFTAPQLLGFSLLQPALDLAYAYGFARGLWLVARGSWSEGGGSRPA
jgi:GT2 family glycosyltransferase